ncbi:MAG: hypothetical protein AAGC56_14095, partial [Pseudomonadota bacterium]
APMSKSKSDAETPTPPEVEAEPVTLEVASDAGRSTGSAGHGAAPSASSDAPVGEEKPAWAKLADQVLAWADANRGAAAATVGGVLLFLLIFNNLVIQRGAQQRAMNEKLTALTEQVDALSALDGRVGVLEEQIVALDTLGEVAKEFTAGATLLDEEKSALLRQLEQMRATLREAQSQAAAALGEEATFEIAPTDEAAETAEPASEDETPSPEEGS